MKSRDFQITVLLIQVFTWIMFVTDVFIIRQIVVFLCFTFIPGIILLRLFKLRDLDLAETLILSVGSSVAFLMLIGLLINGISPMIGLSKPLSQVNSIVITSVALLSLSFLSYMQDRDFKLCFPKKLEERKYLVILSIIFLSVIGTTILNSYKDPFLLLLMLILISGLILLSTSYFKSFSLEFCVLLLFAISAFLLLQKSLVSNYIYGFDIHGEYYISRLIENNSYWNPTVIKGYYADYNSMLSTTVLPVLYSNLMNLGITWIFKIIYPLIYSFVPLGVYILSKMHFGTKIAFLSTFFFIANYDYFTQPTSNAKQMIAELFYVLLLFLVLSRNKKTSGKMLCFVILSFGLITSHYGTSYIFLFLTFFASLSMFFLRKKRKVPPTYIVLFAVMAFSWFVYVSNAVSFERILDAGNNVYRSLSEFFNPQSRGAAVLTAFGLTESPTFWHTIGRGLFYVTEVLIGVGFVSLVVKRKEIKLNPEYAMIISANMAILLMCVALPSFAGSLRMERFYGILLLVLAPLCILGGKTVIERMLRSRERHWSLVLVLVVLIPFFLFQTGFVYEVTRDNVPSSVSLSMYRMGGKPYVSFGLLHESDVLGAKWLFGHVDTERAKIYCDLISQQFVLTSYTSYGTMNFIALARLSNMFLLANTTKLVPGSYVYLGQHSVINGVIIRRTSVFNATELSFVFENANKIYSNGACEIYEDPFSTP